MYRDHSVCYHRAERNLAGVLDWAGSGAAVGCARKTESIVSGVSNVRSLDVVKRTRQAAHTSHTTAFHARMHTHTHTHTHTHMYTYKSEISHAAS